MTCPECEESLALESSGEELDRHMAACTECRELAAELRSNTEALREMAAVELPSVRGAVVARLRAENARRQMTRWGWALAAAAALLIGFGVSRHPRLAPTMVSSGTQVGHAVAPAARPLVASARRFAHRRQAKPPAPPQILKVKMFTSDPDVVIYWIVEPKQGSE
jgi:predicted anti-sigma-YlaC factor YlaD